MQPLHQVDIVILPASTGSTGGLVYGGETTVRCSVPCTVHELWTEQVLSYAQRGRRITHEVIFYDPPLGFGNTLTTKHMLVWCHEGETHRMLVQGVVNRFRGDGSTFAWVVTAEELTSRQDT
jgi:hypothetical protein